MKTITNKLLVFIVIMTVLITAFVPLSNSIVYGETTSDGSVTTPKWTVTFIDIDGTVLKKEEVNDGGDATPPTINAKKGYKFLGWNNWYVNVTSDRTIQAVYELVMDTDKETKGKLGDAGTAEPPAEKIAVATEGGLEVIDTSEDAITTPEIIKNNPTPTTVIDEPQQTMSPTTIVLIALAVLVAVAIGAYFLVMFLRKKRKEEKAS